MNEFGAMAADQRHPFQVPYRPSFPTYAVVNAAETSWEEVHRGWEVLVGLVDRPGEGEGACHRCDSHFYPDHRRRSGRPHLPARKGCRHRCCRMRVGRVEEEVVDGEVVVVVSKA